MINLNTTILSKPRFTFDGEYDRVVQKGNVGTSYVYALQLYRGHTCVLRGRRNDNSSTVKVNRSQEVDLTGSAGGHTQTWEYAGSAAQNNFNGDWFVGTKGQRASDGYDWDIQLARIHFPTSANDNTHLVRLSHLNQVGTAGFDGAAYRTEAAVTPDYRRLMIVALDDSKNAHFGLYDLATINSRLNGVQTSGSKQGHVPLNEVTSLASFTIPTITNNIPSLQGFDIDNRNNIYVSCQPHPTAEAGQRGPRQIVKIPWGETESSNWYVANYNGYNSDLDISGYYTEFEGVQVIDEDSLYLTVAYHDISKGLLTDKNKIFKISGFQTY